MSRRDRLERKIESREEWAEKARKRSEQAFSTFRTISDGIPLGQPILVGHHSEKRHRKDIARIDSALHRSCEESNKANHHDQKAAGLRAMLDSTIFSDDENATEQLEDKARKLEARRDAMKAANAAWRKAKKPDLRTPEGVECLRGVLPDSEIARVMRTVTLCPYNPQPFPGYALTNIGSRIREARARVQRIERTEVRRKEAENAGGVKVEVVGEGIRRRAVITFAEYPGRDTIKALKAAGFFWSRPSWIGDEKDIPPCVEVPRCGCPENAPEADPDAFPCPCGSHCPDCAGE